MQALGTGPLAGLSLPQPPRYRIDSTYQHGSPATSTYVDAGGAALSFKILDQTIDSATGLPSSSRNSSLIQTTYEFDELGRLEWVKPEAGHDAWTEYRYTRATSADALALVEVFHRPNGGGTALAESSFKLDSFSRIWREQRKLADGTFSVRETLYDGGMGWKVSVSELGNTARKTRYLDYDPYGRPGCIVPPDGSNRTTCSEAPALPNPSSHDVKLAYVGARSVARAVTVGDTIGAEAVAWVTQVFDRQGRLYQLKEEAEANFTTTTTTHSYDVGNRLSRVQQSTSAGTQNRYFTYDQRGFLLSEQNPEKGGTSGNGLVFYADYDPRGHDGRKYECSAASCALPGNEAQRAAHLAFAYDRAERLETVTDLTNSPAKLLKSFTYGTSNAASVRNNGRLWKATRYNYPAPPFTNWEVRLAETYSYGGRQGRVSNKTTQLVVNGVNEEAFSQSYAYDPLGNTSQTTYPKCTASDCLGLDSTRTVSPSRSNGWLTGIVGTVTPVGASTPVTDLTHAASIAYHPNGMVKTIVHGNGVTMSAGLDPDFLPRPASFTTAGASLDWSSGGYSYDGAGNVKSIGLSRYTYDHVSRLREATVFAETVAGNVLFTDGLEMGDTSCWSATDSGAGEIPGGTCLSSGAMLAQTYTYDPFGNVNAIAGAGTPSTPTTSAATNRLQAASYDVRGNVVDWNGNDYEYDALNMMTRRVAGAEDWRYIYTADDERFWSYRISENGAGSLFSLRDLDGKVLREYSAHLSWAARDYIYREDQQLASSYPGEGDRYFHLDHLGTPRLVTGAAGAMVSYHAYLPFGEEATSVTQDLERKKFTGHERDTLSTSGAEDDHDYMHSRNYNPLVGRFLSVDPLLEPDRISRAPQKWNRYGYARGNPVRFVDPTGEDERTGWQAGEVVNNSSQAVFIAGDVNGQIVVLELPPGAASTSLMQDTDALIPNDQAFRFGPSGVELVTEVADIAEGAIKIGAGTVNVHDSSTKTLRLTNSLGYLLSVYIGRAGVVDRATAEKNGWVAAKRPGEKGSAGGKERPIKNRKVVRRSLRRAGGDPFRGSGFCSADGACH